jgi:predicted amidophosphoribosyltransferase
LQVNFSSIVATFASLLFPVRCPSCLKSSAEDLAKFGICSKCRGIVQSGALVSYRGPLKIFAGSKYTTNLSRIILAAKEDNQIQARAFLAERLNQSLKKALQEISQNREQAIRDIVVIPIPSRRLADRKRGFAHVELLVAQLMVLNKSLNIQVLNCLSHSKKISDQTSLNFHERAVNMKGAFVVDRIKYLEIYPTKNSNSVVFLVDDLVTTGATVQAANSALLTLGGSVDGVLASCATQGFTH